jgi:starch synthase (maltosyl-transferring)
VAQPLLRRCPEHDLVLVGDGALRDWLHEQAVRNRLADRIHLLGWRNDVPDLLRRADLLLFPSRWEGMPNVILEAMAARTPVLAARAEGVAQLLRTDIEAQTVPFGNGPALVEGVTRILGDASLRSRLVEANFRRVRSEFSQTAMIASYLQLYTLLMSGKPHLATARSAENSH